MMMLSAITPFYCRVPTPGIAREAELLAIAVNNYTFGDKFGVHAKHTYALMYAEHLAPIRHDPLKFLEIGLGCDMPRHAEAGLAHGRKGNGIGASVDLWRAYLPNAIIWFAEFNHRCVEIRRADLERRGLAGVVTGDQSNATVLKRWLSETGGAFDFIVDDGGHSSRQQFETLHGLWPGLLPGGKLVIEDLGASAEGCSGSGCQRRDGGPLSPTATTFTQLIQELLADLILRPYATLGKAPLVATDGTGRLREHHAARLLPGLASIQCYAEACVFTKGFSERNALDENALMSPPGGAFEFGWKAVPPRNHTPRSHP